MSDQIFGNNNFLWSLGSTSSPHCDVSIHSCSLVIESCTPVVTHGNLRVAKLRCDILLLLAAKCLHEVDDYGCRGVEYRKCCENMPRFRKRTAEFVEVSVLSDTVRLRRHYRPMSDATPRLTFLVLTLLTLIVMHNVIGASIVLIVSQRRVSPFSMSVRTLITLAVFISQLQSAVSC